MENNNYSIIFLQIMVFISVLNSFCSLDTILHWYSFCMLRIGFIFNLGHVLGMC